MRDGISPDARPETPAHLGTTPPYARRVYDNPTNVPSSTCISEKSAHDCVQRNTLGTASKDASRAAIQITPGAKELNKLSCGPRAKGKKVTTIRKNIKGVI